MNRAAVNELECCCVKTLDQPRVKTQRNNIGARTDRRLLALNLASGSMVFAFPLAFPSAQIVVFIAPAHRAVGSCERFGLDLMNSK